ncbi:MAG: hypothetical protein J6Z74_03985 [Eubacterium sp.]|nr:hypothetical protein [Eubacterium sp.]
MIKNLTAVIVMLILLVELYLCTASSQHRRKKLIKNWKPVKGTIREIEKKEDLISRKNYVELTIDAPGDRTVYAKVGNLCIYEVGEEVDLMELDGVHRFRGNERVDKKGKQELLLGTLPMLGIIVIAMILSILY